MSAGADFDDVRPWDSGSQVEDMMRAAGVNKRPPRRRAHPDKPPPKPIEQIVEHCFDLTPEEVANGLAGLAQLRAEWAESHTDRWTRRRSGDST